MIKIINLNFKNSDNLYIYALSIEKKMIILLIGFISVENNS